jgi:DtxR family transcriptional regulator, Mn-dependent transcriptional regulator
MAAEPFGQSEQSEQSEQSDQDPQREEGPSPQPQPQPQPHPPQEFHPPVEEYLETMLALAEEGVPVIQARIAERLGRAAPSVSEMLERLTDDGYVSRHGRRLDLTESGRTLAEKVVRKHRLAERLLVDVIGLEWHKVHREAGRWEHVISDDVEARLVELLGDPATCPHGNPIPGSGSVATKVSTRRLTEVGSGERVRLVRISEEVELNLGSLTILGEGGFIPGAVARVGGRDGDDNLEVQVEGGDETLHLSSALTDRLFVGSA